MRYIRYLRGGKQENIYTAKYFLRLHIYIRISPRTYVIHAYVQPIPLHIPLHKQKPDVEYGLKIVPTHLIHDYRESTPKTFLIRFELQLGEKQLYSE